jgi:hypothetical protein
LHDSNEVLEMIVSPQEMKIIECMQNGEDKVKNIANIVGMNYASVMTKMREFKEMGWAKNDDRLSTWQLVKGLTFRSVRFHNQSVFAKDEKILKERKTLKPTYERKDYPQFINSEVIVYHWTPEQIAAHEIEINRNKKYFETKKGEYIRNENYNPVRSAR